MGDRGLLHSEFLLFRLVSMYAIQVWHCSISQHQTNHYKSDLCFLNNMLKIVLQSTDKSGSSMFKTVSVSSICFDPIFSSPSIFAF